MKTASLILVAFAVSGCSSMLISARDTPGDNYASLSLITLHPPGDPTWPYGLLAIDDHELGPQTLQVYVAKGSRTVSYACPDLIIMDGPTRLKHEFVAGEKYELVCDKNSSAFIRLGSHAGR